MLSETAAAPTTERAYGALMPEHTVRALTPDDFADACDVLNAADLAAGAPRVLSPDELAEELELADLTQDTFGVDIDGRLAGLAYTLHLPSEVSEERCYVFGATHPAHRGLGIGRAVLERGVARARAQLASSPRDLPRHLRVERLEPAEDAHRLFLRFGFQPVRWFEELRCPIIDRAPTGRTAPAGVRIVPWPDERDEELRAVKNTAFADHWGSTPTPPEHWAQQTRGFGARLDLSSVAIDEATGAVVAVCLCKRYEADDAVTGRREGWIDKLGTLREWRGRGVASALIERAIEAFREEGLTDASLGVDADSPTGAAGLYRSLGFDLVRRSITYQID